MTELPAPALTTSTERTDGPVSRVPASRTTAAAALAFAVVLAGLDQTIVATALPTIAADLVGPGDPVWVLTAYLLAFAIAVPVLGRLGDHLDDRRVFQVAVGLFLTGSALAAQAGTVEELVLFRVVQGAGAGGMLSGALRHAIAPTAERRGVAGAPAAVFGMVVVAGPVIGGFLTAYASWRWCFLVNLPLGVAALLFGRAVPTRSAPGRDGGTPRTSVDLHERPSGRYDLGGALLLGTGSTSLVLLAAWGGVRYAWDSPVVLALGGAALVALGLFLLLEWTVHRPLLPLGLFRSLRFVVGGLIAVPLGAAVFGLLCLLPAYWQLAGQATPLGAGVMLLPLTAALVVSAVGAGWVLVHGSGTRPFAVLGTAVTAVGLTFVSFVNQDTGFGTYVAITAVTGAGFGATLAALARAVGPGHSGAGGSGHSRVGAPGGSGASAFGRSGAGAPGHDAADLGTAAAMGEAFLRVLGGCLGVAWLAAWNSSRLPSFALSEATAGETPPISALTSQVILLVPALAVGFLLSFALRDPEPDDEDVLGDDWEAGWSDGWSDGWNLTPRDRAQDNGAEDDRDTVPVRPLSSFERRADHDGTVVGAAGAAHDGTAGGTSTAHECAAATDGAENATATVRLTDTGAAATATDPSATPTDPSATSSESSTAPPRPTEDDSEHAALWVTVYEASGEPIGDVTLTLTDLAGRQVARAHRVDIGGYEITPPEPGTYLVIASARGYQPQAVVVGYDGEDGYAELTLYRERGVYGQVVRCDGEPVVGATVTLTDRHGDVVVTRTTDAAGEYEIRDLPSATYTMAVSARAYRPAALVIEIPEAGKVRQDVELAGGARLHGVVRGRPGRRPLPNARVTLIDASGQVRARATADVDGAYRLVDIPEGEYTLVATAQPPAAVVVRINGGEDHEQDMDLRFPDETVTIAAPREPGDGRTTAEPEMSRSAAGTDHPSSRTSSVVDDLPFSREP